MAELRKRNPDEAEEDDIGCIPDAMYLQRQRRKSLLTELRRYYQDNAAIPVKKRKRATKVVEDIKGSLQLFVNRENKSKNENNPPYIFGNIMPQGSSYEGLKVIEPNEFDLLLPLILENDKWSCTTKICCGETFEAPAGYCFIRKEQNTSDYLKPVNIKQEMQSIVDRAINEMNFPYLVKDITLRSSPGPALTLNVCYDDNQNMKIDIVPSIMIDNKLFVAKKHPDADYTIPENMHNDIWRESYSEKEKTDIREMDGEKECRRACLKILKTIREKKKKKASLLKEGLDSYHLKTCMLHLNDNKTIGSWHQDNLHHRFKDLLHKLLDFLLDKKMPNHNSPGVNLLSTKKKISQREAIIKWIITIFGSDDKIIDEMLS